MNYLAAFVLFSLALPTYANEFIPEASAACMVGKTLLIAGDEEPKALWISEEGSIEKVKVKGSAWDDMEGMATVDSTRFFAITSHSLTKKGKQKPEREQLFLFKKDAKISALQTWSLRKSALDFLEKHLSQKLNMKVVRSASPDDGGFNIEGLAYANGNLYLGLRSPVTTSGEAIVLVMTNALQSPEFSKVELLNLGGKGIRGLETEEGALLVLAGSVDDSAGKFSIHQFNLNSLSVNKLDVLGFDRLIRPESVVKNGSEFIFVQDFQVDEGEEVIVNL